MKLSTRTRYGMRILADLAGAWKGSPLSVRELSIGEGISAKYLERIMSVLKAAAIVQPVPGRGYGLARHPRLIHLNEVVRVLEGGCALAPCQRKGYRCPKRLTCPVRPVWDRVAACLNACLGRMTLAEFVEKPRRKTRQAAGRAGKKPRAPR